VGHVYEKVVRIRNVTAVSRGLRIFPPASQVRPRPPPAACRAALLSLAALPCAQPRRRVFNGSAVTQPLPFPPIPPPHPLPRPGPQYFHASLPRFPAEAGVLAPGIAAEVTLRFCPDSLADYEDAFGVDSSGPRLTVPLRARRPPPSLTLPEVRPSPVPAAPSARCPRWPCLDPPRLVAASGRSAARLLEHASPRALRATRLAEGSCLGSPCPPATAQEVDLGQVVIGNVKTEEVRFKNLGGPGRFHIVPEADWPDFAAVSGLWGLSWARVPGPYVLASYIAGLCVMGWQSCLSIEGVRWKAGRWWCRRRPV
jgi:hypothetical protein